MARGLSGSLVDIKSEVLSYVDANTCVPFSMCVIFPRDEFPSSKSVEVLQSNNLGSSTWISSKPMTLISSEHSDASVSDVTRRN